MKGITEFQREKAEILTADEAREYLKKEFVPRKPAEEIRKAIEKKLKKGQTFKDLEKSLNKLFNNGLKRWLSGNPIGRDKLFELCITLNMNSSEAHELICKSCSFDWLHMCYYKDIIYSFYLNDEGGNVPNEEKLLRVRKLLEEFSYLDNAVKVSDSHPRKIDNLTSFMCNESLSIKTEVDLREFLRRNTQCFSNYNEKALFYFRNNINTVKKGYSAIGDDAKDSTPTIEELCNYLLMNINLYSSDIPQNDNISVKFLDRKILGNLLSEEFSECNKKSVDRRWLILSCLLNIYSLSDYGDGNDFDTFFTKISKILDECGMSPLDPRCYFDWAVVNSINIPNAESDKDFSDSSMSALDETTKE